jgi:hypothetical protein
MPDSVSDPDPNNDQDPTQPEDSTEDAPDGTELSDEQLEKAAGGFLVGMSMITSSNQRLPRNTCDE